MVYSFNLCSHHVEIENNTTIDFNLMDTKLLYQIDLYLFLDQLIFPLIILFILLIFTQQIALKTNLIDKPDKIRKFHKHPTPILGGLFNNYNYSRFISQQISLSVQFLFMDTLFLSNWFD